MPIRIRGNKDALYFGLGQEARTIGGVGECTIDADEMASDIAEVLKNTENRCHWSMGPRGPGDEEVRAGIRVKDRALYLGIAWPDHRFIRAEGSSLGSWRRCRRAGTKSGCRCLFSAGAARRQRIPRPATGT